MSSNGVDCKVEEIITCPVCLEVNGTNNNVKLEFVQGACKHPVCFNCMVQILLPNTNYSTRVSSIPSIGQCPVCRGFLSLFDLTVTNCNTTNMIYVNTTKQMLLDADSDGIHLPKDCPILGYVYVHDGEVGVASYHFDHESRRPFVDYSSKLVQCLGWKLDDGSPLPDRVYLENVQWVSDYALLLGSIAWGKDECTGKDRTWKGSPRWNLFIQFDLPNNNVDLESPSVVSGGLLLSCINSRHPLDGVWEVDQPGIGLYEIKLECGMIVETPNDYFKDTMNGINIIGSKNIALFKNSYQHFDVVSITSEEFDLTRYEEEGQPIGSKITFEVLSDFFFSMSDEPEGKKHTMTWTRKSVTGSSKKDCHFISFNDNKIDYEAVEVSSSSSSRLQHRYVPETLWGNVFYQGLRGGLASYHFISEDNVYISYESPLVAASWPPLDNGEPVPKRMPFDDISWNDESKTFTGTINWFNRFNTSWSQCVAWKYRIVFDSNMLFVSDGEVLSIKVDGSQDKMSVFCQDLFYVNPMSRQYILSLLGDNDLLPQNYQKVLRELMFKLLEEDSERNRRRVSPSPVLALLRSKLSLAQF